MSDQTITISGNATPLVDAESLRVAADGSASSLTRRDSASTVSVPAQQLETVMVTVKTAVRSTYAYCARAARRLHWFITVKADAFAAMVESRVRAFIQNVFPKTGVDILRQSAILNI